MNAHEVDVKWDLKESEQEPQGWICDKIIDALSQMVPPLSNFEAVPLDNHKQNLKEAMPCSFPEVPKCLLRSKEKTNPL